MERKVRPYAEKLRECEALAALKRETLRPRLEGQKLTTLTERAVDTQDAIIIMQGEYAYGSSRVKGSRYLVTLGLDPCISIIGYNPGEKLGFLAHVDYTLIVREALEKADLAGCHETVLFGGKMSYWSTETLAVMEAFLETEEFSKIKVVGRDVLRGPKQRSQKIVLDTETGEMFIPSNLKAIFEKMDEHEKGPMELPKSTSDAIARGSLKYASYAPNRSNPNFVLEELKRQKR